MDMVDVRSLRGSLFCHSLALGSALFVCLSLSQNRELSHQQKKRKHINSFQSLNDVIHWSPSTINVPSGEKTETHQLSPILERCHPLESFNYKCPIRRKTRQHINSLQSLNDALHWSPSTMRQLGHPVNPIGGEQ
ncbi:hypothetical protein TNCV_3184071 [Trichonephila clavipes]|nr:hypothetical protein TNCV_3184071 [Trichonephila clavipes]